MTPKIIWPQIHKADSKGNPFGSIDGFRRLTVTFDSTSFEDNLSVDDKKALNILLDFANEFDYFDAMSFGDEILPKIVVGSKEGEFDVQVMDKSGKAVQGTWISEAWIEIDGVIYGDGYSIKKQEKNLSPRQELLEVASHHALGRDLFITSSRFLLDNRHRRLYMDANIRTPSEALKIVGLHLRTINEYKWVIKVEGKQNKSYYLGVQESFYNSFVRGRLPGSWRYISSLGYHPHHEKLLQLGWSILDRCSRALQARDEIARLFYKPETNNTKAQRIYHFDYLTLLLTAALDVEALVINELYQLKLPKGKRLSESDCGVQRQNFRIAIKNEPRLSAVSALLDTKEDYIKILFGLRNKIHSISWEESFELPDNYVYELFDTIYNYDLVGHWGIDKQKVNISKNGKPPILVYEISVEIYILVEHLIDEGFSLIDQMLNETKIEPFLDSATIGKILNNLPDDNFLDDFLTSKIATSLLLG